MTWISLPPLLVIQPHRLSVCKIHDACETSKFVYFCSDAAPGQRRPNDPITAAHSTYFADKGDARAMAWQPAATLECSAVPRQPLHVCAYPWSIQYPEYSVILRTRHGRCVRFQHRPSHALVVKGRSSHQPCDYSCWR